MNFASDAVRVPLEPLRNVFVPNFAGVAHLLIDVDFDLVVCAVVPFASASICLSHWGVSHRVVVAKGVPRAAVAIWSQCLVRPSKVETFGVEPFDHLSFFGSVALSQLPHLSMRN